MTVDEFLAAEAALPTYPGACCRMVDKWFQARMGFSALSRYGRDFVDDQDVSSWLSEPGGIAVGINRVARASGVNKTKKPRKGDIGIVLHEGRLCAAIHAGTVWVGRGEDGMFGSPLEACWKAWRIE